MTKFCIVLVCFSGVDIVLVKLYMQLALASCLLHPALCVSCLSPSFMKDAIGKAYEMQEKQFERSRDEAEKKEARKRSFQEAQFKHDKEERDEERLRREYRDDKHRREDRSERDEVRAVEKAERDERRADEREKRAHDIQMMELRVKLAQAENKHGN